MVAYNKMTYGVDALTKTANAGTDAFSFALAATITAGANPPTFTPGTTDLATGGGYTAGGKAVATTSYTNNGTGTDTLILAAPSAWTATGAGFTFRYVLLVDTTINLVLGYWDYGSNVTMNGTNGDTFTFTPDAVNGVFQVT